MRAPPATSRVAHVEAGLRSFDLEMPEERNRIEVDRLSALLLCPDERSAAQLEVEGVAGRRVVVGDVMADAARLFAPLARTRSSALARVGVEPGRYAVVTVHREANVTRPDRLARIVEGLRRVDGPLVFPAHPRTRAALARVAPDLELAPPIGYLDLAALVSQARVVLTDSGGLQKEAYWYRVPCVTLRPSTEWVDTVEAGANVLVDDDPEAIAAGRRGCRAFRRPHRSSTVTVMPRIGSRQPCTLDRRAGGREQHHYDVAVIGAGYVGVPLAATFATAGRRVLLVDIQAEVVAALNAGRSHIEDVPSEQLAELTRAARSSRRRTTSS